MRSILLILCMALVGCNPAEKPTQSLAEIKTEVNTLMNDWHAAASEANYENYFSKMDNISIFIGTDASENWGKKAFQDFSKPYFDRGKAWDFKVLERNVYTSKNSDVVWFDELLKTWMGTCRGSGVLEKESDTWKIKHYVLSVTIPNDDIQKVMVATKERDSIFQSKFLK